LRKFKPEIYRIAGKYGASKIRIFGSTVRNEENLQSDIDILVHFEHGK